jgi:hypothetical protein
MHSIPAITHVAVTVTDVASDEIRGEPLAADKLVTDSVTLGTGGPACGVDFTEHGAAAWYQNWFTESVYVALADDVANYLADVW